MYLVKDIYIKNEQHNFTARSAQSGDSCTLQFSYLALKTQLTNSFKLILRNIWFDKPMVLAYCTSCTEGFEGTKEKLFSVSY